jgi:HD-GYP domain-containing protein (c-di-GMP phosphodiesterase class II)
MVGWSVISVVLFISYIGEYLKGARSGEYVAVFLICIIVPYLLCLFKYYRHPSSEKLKSYIVVGYFVMYVFCMLTGSTNMVFSYILPLLSILILYHDSKLILYTGVASLVVNVCFVIVRILNGEINLMNSREAEIQIALIVLCFSGCYAATLIYDNITKQNEEFVARLEKTSEEGKMMTLQTIRTIINTLDAKDEYTKGHSQRVSEYSGLLATELGLDKQDVENVKYIALLHDIGKIGIPDTILNKAGKLSDEEYETMKRHTLVGGDILKDIDAIDGLSVGAKYHHERYDGKGYPEGLKGEEIPYVARIIGIADAYDAMTSNRIYRGSMSNEEVYKEIKRCSGTQFDPDMARVFLKLMREGKLKNLP